MLIVPASYTIDGRYFLVGPIFLVVNRVTVEMIQSLFGMGFLFDD